MKKLIAVLALLLFALQPFDVSGQKTERTSQKTDISISPQEVKDTEVFSDGNGVLLQWKTGAEKNLAGFNIYRREGKENVRVNKNFVLSSLLKNGENIAGFGSEYNFFDENGTFQSSYIIELVYTNGTKSSLNAVSPRYTPNLKNVSNLSSQDFRNMRSNAAPIIEESKTVSGDNFKNVTSPTATDFEKQKWVAAQTGVKISIVKEGFYRVTRTELAAAGFNVNSDSSRWQLYLNGVEQSIIVESNDQYVEFYGAKFTDTQESGKQPYFLINAPTAGKRIGEAVSRRLGASVVSNNFHQVQTTKERLYYISTLLNGDQQNYFGTFFASDPVTVNFNLNGVDQSIPQTEIFVTVQGFSTTSHNTKIVVNGVTAGTITGSNHDSMTLQTTIPTSALNEGTNALQLSTVGVSSDFSLFDSITVNLQRKYSADQNQLSFATKNYKTSKVTGFTSPNIRLFDISSESDPVALNNLSVSGESGSYSLTIPSYRGRLMYAVADNAVKQADSIIQNVPSTFSNDTHDGKLLIITHRNWLTQANQWAVYRRADGFTVEVVDVEDVYDEFNYGKLSSKSITDFIQYAKNNWKTPPSYVLLMGDATSDPRNYTGVGDFNFMPTKLVDTIYSEAGSDDALTDFNNDGLAEIPIGRLPVRTSGEVTQLLYKVSIFEQTSAQNSARGALCASDLPDGYDFAAVCSRVFNELPGTIPKSFVNRGDANAPSNLLSAINSGKYIVNYSGHGNRSIWATSGFFGNSIAANLTNGNNLSIFTMLTCLNGDFIDPQAISLGETLLQTQNGGAVAAWASSGLTTPDIQEIMARRFYNQLGAGNLTRMGDLVNDAKTVISGGRDVRLSWVLLGDPTLKVR